MSTRGLRRKPRSPFGRMLRWLSRLRIGRKLGLLSRGLSRQLVNLVWPRKCVVCRRILEEQPGFLCSDCLRHMPEPRGGSDRVGDAGRCVCVCSYEGAWRESLLRYKFGGKRMYAKAYGPLLAAVIDRELNGQYDLISYVPLSRKRLKSRGYDQAMLLAQSAAHELGTEAVCLLKKVRNNKPQSGTGNAAKRKANVLGSYTAADPAAVRGRRILLIDDIVTTGSTLSEAVRVLLQSGAASVVCAAFAKTPPRKEPP